MATYPIAIVMSPAKGVAGLFLSPRAKMTRGELVIDVTRQMVEIKGTSALTQSIDRQFSFDAIEAIESKGPLLLTFFLKDGKQVALKDVEDLAEILRCFDGKVTDKTHQLVRRRIDKFEKRLGKT